MSIPRSVAEVLREHVVLEVEAIDRMYLNVYVPHLQSVGAVVGYLRVHRGQRFASTTAVTPMTEAFVRNIDQFINHEGVDLIAFQKWQRKDDVTQKYLRRFTQCEGVLYVGKAQEKARVTRTERRRSRHTGGTYPWIVESTAMVNHYPCSRLRPGRIDLWRQEWVTSGELGPTLPAARNAKIRGINREHPAVLCHTAIEPVGDGKR